MSTIKEIRAREILDSRGNPTVWAAMTLDDGATAWSSVPSGASTGSREALELRDVDNPRMNSKGVLGAIDNIRNEIIPAVLGRDVHDQRGLDEILVEMGGPLKTRLGANATLAISIAAVKASAASKGIPLYRRFEELHEIDRELSLPVPMANLLNGGAHASGSTDFQEFMAFPTGVDNFEEALQAVVEIYGHLRAILDKKGHHTTVGDEGGFAPSGITTREALELLCSAVESAGWKPGDQIFIALDPAASELWDKERKHYDLKNAGQIFSSDEMIDEYERLAADFPIVSIEDGLDEDDWEGWTRFVSRVGDRIQIVGDDLLVTQEAEVRKALDLKAANAVLVKINQVGTISETLDTIALAQKNGWGTVISHRSGETEDTTIADLAVGTGARQIKTGAPARVDRTAKYNRLLLIGDELGGKSAPYISPL